VESIPGTSTTRSQTLRTAAQRLNGDSPVSWAKRFGSKPLEELLCPPADGMGCHELGPHVHDRAGVAHPVTPDGRWTPPRPAPPTRTRHRAEETDQ
jgi:hypothetical protein